MGAVQELSKYNRHKAEPQPQPAKEESKPALNSAQDPSASKDATAAAPASTSEPGKSDEKMDSEPSKPPEAAKGEPAANVKEEKKTADASSASETPMAVFAGVSEKAKRTELHTFFKNDLKLPKLVTDTIKHPDGSVDIRVMAQSDLKATVKKYASTLSPCFFCTSLHLEATAPGYYLV